MNGNAKIFLRLIVFIALFLCFYEKLVPYSQANRNDTIINDNLVSLAKKIAAEKKIEVDELDYIIYKENNFIVVEFYSKSFNKYGGGVKIFFKEENGEYKYFKIMRGQ